MRRKMDKNKKKNPVKFTVILYTLSHYNPLQKKKGTFTTLKSLQVVTLALQRLDSTGPITHCAYVNI